MVACAIGRACPCNVPIWKVQTKQHYDYLDAKDEDTHFVEGSGGQDTPEVPVRPLWPIKPMAPAEERLFCDCFGSSLILWAPL